MAPGTGGEGCAYFTRQAALLPEIPGGIQPEFERALMPVQLGEPRISPSAATGPSLEVWRGRLSSAAAPGTERTPSAIA